MAGLWAEICTEIEAGQMPSRRLANCIDVFPECPRLTNTAYYRKIYSDVLHILYISSFPTIQRYKTYAAGKAPQNKPSDEQYINSACDTHTYNE
jgi:hypothetical protein